MPLACATVSIATEGCRAVSDTADIAAGRLPPQQVAANFADAHPPLTAHEALVEASRCYFCYDAPCMEACPTGIDIPGFIRKIATGNLRGVGADDPRGKHLRRHVRARLPDRDPVRRSLRAHRGGGASRCEIGALQRHATDWLMAHEPSPFVRGAADRRRVAVVGAGPAGLVLRAPSGAPRP